jgi:HD superfamily phosphohydrolase
MSSNDYSFFLTPRKTIRDLCYERIRVSEFFLTLIDTPQFQRLRDIRQLTAQYVYPNAQHTRFEHSLGVFELTRRAIETINKNGYLDNTGDVNSGDAHISDQLAVDTLVAALLHDIGHLPFSHAGEMETDERDVDAQFENTLRHQGIDTFSDIKNIAKHEKISCIVILKKMTNGIYLVCKETAYNPNYEFIIRCITGVEYKSYDKFIENICISLINSKSIDMDKLDYIIRDSFNTGLNTPKIQIERIFNYMFLEKNNGLVFEDHARPHLSDVILTRDRLYEYVIKHHAVVYSDYLLSYLLRKLTRNMENIYDKCDSFDKTKDFAPGAIRKDRYLSVNAVVERMYSDSHLWTAITAASGNDDSSIPNEIINNINEKRRIDNAKDVGQQLLYRRFNKPLWKTLPQYKKSAIKYFDDDYQQFERFVEKVFGIFNGQEHEKLAKEWRSEIIKKVREKADKDIFRQNDIFLLECRFSFYKQHQLENIFIAIKNGFGSTKNWLIAPLPEIEPTKKELYKEQVFYLFVKDSIFKKPELWTELKNIIKKVFQEFADMSIKEFWKRYYEKSKTFEEFCREFIEDKE